MANARLIRQNFFNQPKLAKYTIEERYLIIGLACTADDWGRLWYNTSNIKSIIFPTYKNITEDWIEKVIEKLIKDGILCKYEDDNTLYLHFPLWFKVGWYLKQKIDNPKEFGDCPDCPICLTQELKLKKREISRAIQSNKKEFNEKETSVSEEKINLDVVRKVLSGRSFIGKMIDKYPLITYEHYIITMDRYLNQVEKHEAWNNDHKREFEVWIEGVQEKFSKKDSK